MLPSRYNYFTEPTVKHATANIIPHAQEN